MKTLIAALVLAFPATAMADYLDVIEFKQTCDLDEYMVIVEDFNAWGKDYGYRAEVWMALMRDNLETAFWVGRAKDAETFGNAWDTWRDALSDPNSAPARMWARMEKCETNLNRSGFDTYK